MHVLWLHQHVSTVQLNVPNSLLITAHQERDMMCACIFVFNCLATKVNYQLWDECRYNHKLAIA